MILHLCGNNQSGDMSFDTRQHSVAKKWRSDFADRDLVGMNERNGARLRLPASCSLSSYIVLLFENCRRRRGARRGREPAAKVGETKMEEGEAGAAVWFWSGLFWCRVTVWRPQRIAEDSYLSIA